MSILCNKWKENLLQGTASALLNGSGTTGVYAALIDTGVHTISAATEFYNAGGASDFIDGVVGTPVEITSSPDAKTYTNGVFNGSDVTFTAVPGPTTIEAVGIFIKNAGADTTWRVVGYLDNSHIAALPIPANGGNITVTWNASGIFGL